MLEAFTRQLLYVSFTAPELKGLYSQHKTSDGNVAIVLNAELRGLLFREISREHLERVSQLVFVDGLVFVEAIRAALDGSVPSPMVQGML
jgi:hypothetical protein